MKKRYLVLAGVLAAAVAAAGCGKKDKNTDTSDKDTQVTVAPAEDGSSASADSELVDMQKTTDEDIKNVIGDKTDTASKLVIINKTGSDVARLYIRPNSDDDDWGDDLIQGMFTFTNGDKALYYFDKTAKDADGNTVTSYDIRISYTDENKNECFFRKIPLQNITQISLCMDGTGEDSIPYASYLSGSSKKETSTLNEVKQRLGLTDSEESDTEEEENTTEETTDTVTPTPAPTAAVTETPAPTAEPETPSDSGETDITDAGAAKAESFIGQSLDSLIAACGEPSGSDYENEPETGETGYHYYDTFTVSTAVDENGNEVVAGVY